jgi:hypothetical protein
MASEWYATAMHIAVADQLFLAASRRGSTYVFAVSVTLQTAATLVQETQAQALQESLVVPWQLVECWQCCRPGLPWGDAARLVVPCVVDSAPDAAIIDRK